MRVRKIAGDRIAGEQLLLDVVEPLPLCCIMLRHQSVPFFSALRAGLAIDCVFRPLPMAEGVCGAFDVKPYPIDFVAIAKGLIGLDLPRRDQGDAVGQHEGMVVRFGHMRRRKQERAPGLGWSDGAVTEPMKVAVQRAHRPPKCADDLLRGRRDTQKCRSAAMTSPSWAISST